MRRFGFQKKGEMDAIKFVGGSPSRIVAAKAIVEAGIAVIGHVGLTPQAISVLGGFRPQGRNVASAVKVVETALALQEAGMCACTSGCRRPAATATATAVLETPTIGIGAGPYCSGHVTPKFCEQYARVGDVITKALLDYKEDANGFLNELQKLGL